MLQTLDRNFKQIFMTEKNHPKNLSQIPKDQLKIFLNYYLLSLKSVSPLMPDWIEPILKGDPSGLHKKLKKALDDPFATYQDEHLQWAIGNVDPEEIIKHWKTVADRVYQPLYDAWYA
jgi:hypothetical protein